MKKTSKNKIEEFIRVDHAGERGAIKIYEGQLLALNTIVRNDELKKKLKKCKYMKKNIVIISKKKSKEETLNQQNFYHYGICWVLGLALGLL
tara:strand:- start:225 stop:500 length:276 start_codon:yes stop_codon:yes gene_type:complete